MSENKIFYYRCPKGSRPLMDYETCRARKVRKHRGCVSCRVPNQKRREAAIKDKDVKSVEKKKS